MECGGTGFRGRTAIHELLDLSDHIRELILETPSQLRNPARRPRRRHEFPARIGLGQESGAGVSTLKEINKIAFIESTR